MFVHVLHPLGFDSLVEVLVTDENNGEIRLANPVFERLVSDLTGQNPVGAEDLDLVTVFQPDLDGALEPARSPSLFRKLM